MTQENKTDHHREVHEYTQNINLGYDMNMPL